MGHTKSYRNVLKKRAEELFLQIIYKKHRLATKKSKYVSNPSELRDLWAGGA